MWKVIQAFDCGQRYQRIETQDHYHGPSYMRLQAGHVWALIFAHGGLFGTWNDLGNLGSPGQWGYVGNRITFTWKSD
jgi:hypothetical protein